MSEYKCISCGEVRESKKICSCPVCGYRMFETPYDKMVILKQEIKNFIGSLRVAEIEDDALEFYREENTKDANAAETENDDVILKEDDDERFPDFQTIQRYVYSSAKTEVFCERLDESIHQIRKHLQKTYCQEYKVNLEEIKSSVEALDLVLTKVSAALSIELVPDKLELPILSLKYSEQPDGCLFPIAEDLLDATLQLSRKILRFIKQNNIYGTAYRYQPDSTFQTTKNSNYITEFTRIKKQIEKVLSTRYTVDLLSDGYEELSEMLSVLWIGIEAVMSFPVLAKTYCFTFDDGTIVFDDEVKAEILKRINRRYADIDKSIDAVEFLAGKTEEQLFKLYDQMIELDTFGFMGIRKKKMLKVGESEKKLHELIGLSEVKESIKKVKAYALMNKDSNKLNLHMCFLGNPGSGKTEVARLVANILYENKILPTNKFIEVDRSGLVSQYFGATAEKTSQVIKKAMGGVLFIDEAYALGNNSDEVGITDYGKEALDTLVKAMEDQRGKFCVILAGYRNEMQKMMSINPGFRSRIQFTLDFPNYSHDELREITLLMLSKRNYLIAEAALDRILDITDVKRKDPNFANAREIRNILDQVIMCQNLRCMGTTDNQLEIVDVNKYIAEAKLNLPIASSQSVKNILSGEEELDQLVGLDTVKRMVKKIKAYAKRNQGQEDFNLHMCFYGNPGTGKTEVARILSRILYNAAVLDEAKLIETDAHGLLGKFVGATASKTQQKINESMGGVLFIDEAYALTNTASHTGGNTGYGEDAIAVLLKEMEDRRGQFCVILAGYKNEMKEMLSSNPGMESRIQFTLEFPDYTRDELGMIAQSFLKKKRYTISENALSRFLDVMEYYRNQPNFANARTVRNVLDQVIMNQNLRTEDETDDSLITLEDVEDYLKDEQLDISKSSAATRRIGFA